MSTEMGVGVEHTRRPSPFPWRLEEPEPESGQAMVEGPFILDANGRPVCEVLSQDDGEVNNVDADLALLLAAPDMLAALEGLVRCVEEGAGMSESTAAFLVARAAIAKARREASRLRKVARSPEGSSETQTHG